MKLSRLANVFLLVTIIRPVSVEALEVGDAAPAFTVYAEGKEPLHSAALAGKVIILTYEAKDTVDKNKRFKDRVLEDFPREPDKVGSVTIVPVISCFEFIWPFSRFCINEVQRNASRLRLSLYDDRTGRLFKDYGMQENESNVVIIDQYGIIRYRHAGKIKNTDITGVIGLVHALEQQRISPP